MVCPPAFLTDVNHWEHYSHGMPRAPSPTLPGNTAGLGHKNPQRSCNLSLFSLSSKYGRKRSDQSLGCLGPRTPSERLSAPGAPRPAWAAGRPDCRAGGCPRLDHVDAPRTARTGGTPAVVAGAAPDSLCG